MIIIHFYRGQLAPDEVAQFKRSGVRLRDASVVSIRDFVEQCDFVSGDVPEVYAHIPRVHSSGERESIEVEIPDGAIKVEVEQRRRRGRPSKVKPDDTAL